MEVEETRTTTRKRARGDPTKPATRVKVTTVSRPAYPPRVRPPPGSNPEHHYIDNGLTAFDCTTTGTIALINTILPGSSQNSRFGKRIRMLTIQFRGMLFSRASTSVATGAIILVYDRAPGTTLPGITDILVSAHPASLNNDTNSARFKIVRRWDFGIAGTPGVSGSIVPFNEFVKFTSARDVVYKAANTGAIGDISEGALYLVTVGTHAGDAGLTASLASRIRFVDV